VEQTRSVNNAALRWPMHATRATPRSQRASRAITVSLVIATTFVMHAMVGRRSRQLKMPRPDAYEADEGSGGCSSGAFAVRFSAMTRKVTRVAQSDERGQVFVRRKAW